MVGYLRERLPGAALRVLHDSAVNCKKMEEVDAMLKKSQASETEMDMELE